MRKRQAATSRYTPTRSTETRVNSPSDSESNSSLRWWRLQLATMGRWQRESLSLPRCSHFCLYSRDFARWYQLNSSTQENVHLTLPRLAAGRDRITVVGLTWVCLQLNCCCDSKSSCYTYNRWFSSRPRSPVKHSVLCKYKHVYYVTNCSTEVGEHPILFFLFFVEESSKRAAKTIACPCRKHVRGYTAGVRLNTNICLTHAPQRVARSRIVLSLFL